MAFLHKFYDASGNDVILDRGKYYVIHEDGTRSAYDTLEDAIQNATNDDIVVAGEKGDIRAEDARARNISILASTKVETADILKREDQYRKGEIYRKMIQYGLIEGYNIAGLQMRLDADEPAPYDSINGLWSDLSGSGWNAELQGGTSFENSGFRFTGVGDSYMRVPHLIPEGDLTISTVVKSETMSGNAQVVFNTFPHNCISLAMNYNGFGELRCYIGSGGAWTDIIYSDAVIAADTEVCLTVTCSTVNGTKLYVNGELVGSSTFYPSGYDTQTSFFNLGNNVMVSEAFVGYMRNFNLYTAELSAAQVQTLANLAVPRPNLDYFTLQGYSLKGLFPAYGDASSSGSARVDFNFGQRPFLGDPKGYLPYDVAYDPKYWVGASFDGNNIYTGNLGTATYRRTPYQSGRYYFEATITGSPHSDAIGMNVAHTGQYNNSGRYCMAQCGSYSAHNPTHMSGIGDANALMPNKSYSIYSYTILSGDTVQVYLDYDNDSMLLQKLGTSRADLQFYFVGQSPEAVLP